MKKPIFIKNAVILTACSIILRLLGVAFKVWAAARIGGEGMGVYQLIISVYWLFCAFSQTGVSVAVTRLCADCISLKRDFRPVMKRAFMITGATAFVSFLIMFGFSADLSHIAVGKEEYSLCFRLLSLSIIPVGFSACFRGFFFAVRKAGVSAFSQIFEQIIRICLSFFLVSRYSSYGIAAACLALAAGDCVSETVCAALLFLGYRRRAKKLVCGLPPFMCGFRSVLRISFPLTAGKYVGLALRTAENVMVPRSLTKSGIAGDSALEAFGNIKALALPVLLFPSALLSAVSSLLVPEISAAAVKNRRAIVKDTCERIIRLTLLVSVIIACVFAFCGREIGLLLYKNQSVGALLCVLSPLVPLMFIDIVCDGMLKGLDCQRFSFFVNVSDGALRLAGVIFLLPKYSIAGFIMVMYFSNVYTAALNIGMLIKKSGGSIDTVKTVFLPLVFSLIITKTATLILSRLINNTLMFVFSFTFVSLALYCLCLFVSRCITPYEIRETVAR